MGYNVTSLFIMAADEVSSSKDVREGPNKLRKWLNKNMKIHMTDGRVLIGIFVCTDKDCNVILGSCQEYLNVLEDEGKEEPRILGLAMIPGHHIVSVEIDDTRN